MTHHAEHEPVVLDGGGRRCVQLLIELRRLIDSVPAGRVIHLITIDPAAPIDLPAWCHLTGHTYLGPLPASDRPAYALRTEPAALVTHERAPWHSSTRPAPEEG